MFKKILVALALVSGMAVPLASNETTGVMQVAYGESYSCPDCGCSLVYTGRDEWCVGVRCRHIQIMRCGCCGKNWKVYVD
jgi:hypothetical protein